MSSILIVDSDEPTLKLLESFFREQMDLSCRTARSGGEAVQILSEQPADVVLSEIELPDMDGFELMERIRPVPVVLMASGGRGYTKVDVLERGAKEFFSKPLSLMMVNVGLVRLLQQTQ
jgi:DNA-binding response OmpR family regulator